MERECCEGLQGGGLNYFLGQTVPILDCSGQERRVPVLCPCWDESELPVVTSALARVEGSSFDLRPGQWTGPLWILYSMEIEPGDLTASLQCGPFQCLQHVVDTGGVSISTQ